MRVWDAKADKASWVGEADRVFVGKGGMRCARQIVEALLLVAFCEELHGARGELERELADWEVVRRVMCVCMCALEGVEDRVMSRRSMQAVQSTDPVGARVRKALLSRESRTARAEGADTADHPAAHGRRVPDELMRCCGAETMTA